MNETEPESIERSAALRTMKLESETMSRPMKTELENLQEVRSGVRFILYSFGMANLGRRGRPLNCSIFRWD